MRTLIFALCLIFLPWPSHAADVVAGTWTVIQGLVTVQKIGSDQPVKAREGERFSVGDLIRTNAQSRAQAMLSDKTVMNLSPGTSVRILLYSIDRESGRRLAVVKVQEGKVRIITPVEKNSRFNVESPHAAFGFSSSADLVADVTSEQTTVAVLSGAVQVKNIEPLYVGNVDLAANQLSTIRAKQPPAFAAPLSPTLRKAYRQDARSF